MRIKIIRNMVRRRKIRPLAAELLLELFLFTLLPPGLGFLFHPVDPFFLQSSFPVLIGPPFLFALRYGSAPAMGSVALTGIGLYGAFYYRVGNVPHYPGPLLLGILLLTLITGEATDRSLSQLQRSKIEKDLLARRFGQFTNAYHVMKISHDQLKEQLANTRFSLRDALQMVREKLQKRHKDGRGGLSAKVGDDVLSALGYFCAIQIAGIYPVDDTGKVARQPIAVKGKMGEFKENDPLIGKTLLQGALVSVLPETYIAGSPDALGTDLLAAVPIKDSSDRIWGIVAVAEMHFSAFQSENLNLMQLICAYTGDLLSQAAHIFYAADDRQNFIGELENTWRLAGKFGIVSSLICIDFKKKHPPEAFLDAIVNRLRSLDHAWFFSDSRNCMKSCLLMPLMGETEYLHFRNHLDDYLTEKFGHGVEAAGGIFRHVAIDGQRPFQEIAAKVIGETEQSTVVCSGAPCNSGQQALSPFPSPADGAAECGLCGPYPCIERLSLLKKFSPTAVESDG